MKKIFVKLFISFSFSLFADLCNAQFNTYHPFPNNHARWGVEYKTNTSEFEYYSYFLRGDTIVNGKTYFKLNKAGGWDSFHGWLIYDSLKCLIREDTAAKKIYASFKPNMGTVDTLLYDFNLNVGDTLPGTYNTMAHNAYVISIDSILIGTHYRKQFIIGFRFSLGGNDSLIEGIGSAWGLLELIPFENEFWSSLLCFTQNDTTVYPFLNDSCSSLIVGEPTLSDKSMVNVFPNPSNGVFTMQLSVDGRRLSVEVYNVLGEKVYSNYQITKSSNYQIDLSTNPSGIYLFRVVVENGELLGEGKLIIQK